MADIIIIEKNGNVKQSTCKNIGDLYKSCGFRKQDGFELRHAWENLLVGKQKYNISVYSRDSGKANTENKYDLPPPIDTDLYFGNLAIINTNKKGELSDLTVDEWTKIYESLFGGFENLDDFDDDNEEDELDSVPENMKTKIGGYLKDGFIVDDDDDDDEIDADSEDEEVLSMNNSGDESNKDDDMEDEEEDDIEDCGSELDYEDYEYTDED